LPVAAVGVACVSWSGVAVFRLEPTNTCSMHIVPCRPTVCGCAFAEAVPIQGIRLRLICTGWSLYPDVCLTYVVCLLWRLHKY
jgi:hypothetical protein